MSRAPLPPYGWYSKKRWEKRDARNAYRKTPYKEGGNNKSVIICKDVFPILHSHNAVVIAVGMGGRGDERQIGDRYGWCPGTVRRI